MKKRGNDEYADRYQDRYQDRDSQTLNIKVDAGFLNGDRLEQIHIPRDQDHPSYHLDRFMRKQLEMPPFPELIPITFVRMAIATVVVSISYRVSLSNSDANGTLVLGLFFFLGFISMVFYCGRAIATQPKLKFGVIYLWLCIAFGAIFGVIGEKYV